MLKGRHFIGRHLALLRHCVGLSWLTECLTGTFWLTDQNAGTKPLNRDCPGENGTYGKPMKTSFEVNKHRA